MKAIVHPLTYTLAFILYLPATAQEVDSTYTLSEVPITEERVRPTALGTPIRNASDINAFQVDKLSELLAREGLLYIKTYGLGSLSTSSIRGGNASQTLLLWNGIPLQNPMLGQLDLSLLPADAVENISLQKGGNSALWGSGAIGGTLSLNSEADFKRKFSLQALSSLGNWGKTDQQLILALGNSSIQSRTKVFYSRAKNDFPYVPAPGLAPKRQTNAALKQLNLLQDLSLRLGKNKVDLHYWYQESYRQIPPTSVQNQSQAFQEDRANRLVLSYSHHNGPFLIKAKTAWIREDLDFYDPQILLESESRFQNIIAELGIQYRHSHRHWFFIGSTLNHFQAWSTGYRHSPTENRQSVFASWKWQRPSLEVKSSLRQQWVDLKRTPLMPELAIGYDPAPFLKIKAKVSRNYRLPTLNDRYWSVGGNPDLKPESGFSEEIRLDFQQLPWMFFTHISIGAFNRNISNWIIWSIKPGDSFWSANNITRVWSRGLETSLKKSVQVQKLKMAFSGGYDLIYSTNQTELIAPRMKAGTQLLYTPRHQAFASIEATWRAFSLNYQHRLVGSSQGINASIPAFHTGDLFLSWKWNRRNIGGQTFLQINNLNNQQYQVIERRPMPGIHFLGGIKLTIHKSIHK